MGLTGCPETWWQTTKLCHVTSQNRDDLIYTMAEAIHNAEYRLVYYETILHKTWFDEECSKLGDQNETTQFSLTQRQRQISRDNLNNVRRKKALEVLRTKI